VPSYQIFHITYTDQISYRELLSAPILGLYINQGSIPIGYFFTYWFRVIRVLVFLESSIAEGYK
jgi:hypothetical protein